MRGAGQAVKTVTIGGVVGYVGWEKLTTDKSVVHVANDAVIDEPTVNTLAGAADRAYELMGKVGKAVNSVSGAVTDTDNKLNGVSNFLRRVPGSGGLDMFGSLFRNFDSDDVPRLSIVRLVAAAFPIPGYFDWLGGITSVFLGVMLTGNSTDVFRTPEIENIQRTRTSEFPTEEQAHGGGVRR